jgi:hypothetical protein
MNCIICTKEFIKAGINASRQVTCLSQNCIDQNRKNNKKIWYQARKGNAPAVVIKPAHKYVDHNDPKRDLQDPEVRFRNLFITGRLHKLRTFEHEKTFIDSIREPDFAECAA